MISKAVLLSTALAAGSFSAALAQDNAATGCDPANESCAQIEDQMEPSAGDGGTVGVTGGSQGDETGDADTSPDASSATTASDAGSQDDADDTGSQDDANTAGNQESGGSTAGGTDVSTGDSDTSGESTSGGGTDGSTGTGDPSGGSTGSGD